MKALPWGAAVLLITFLGYWLFPGHTYLQSDTQIYIPMLERLHDPALFSRDIVALRPHLSFTIYDETALLLRGITRSNFEIVLTAEQLMFRALAICGLIMIALRLGLNGVQSFFAAAVVSMGATILGPAVLTIEYEPVPRGFAISLIVFALGLIAQERYIAAGATAGIAFLYHPPTTLPFWGLAILLVIARRLRWTILAPLAVAGALLALLARIQHPGIESASVFQRLDPAHESLQRMRAAYSFVSTWAVRQRIDLLVQAVVAAIAFWRLREIRAEPPCEACGLLDPAEKPHATHGGSDAFAADSFLNELFGRCICPLRDFLWGLPVLGLLSVPLSWLLLERMHWALIPEWQPARAILFVSLIAALLAAVAAMRATNFAERLLCLTAAFLMPMQHAMVGSVIHYRPLLLAVALGLVTTALYAFRKEALVLAGIIPFFAIPQSKLVDNYRRIETTELRQLADWARNSTPQPALFLFPDSSTSLEPGTFRARALRGLYVDWKSGGQVNYFPEFARIWSTRWTETGSGHWSVTPSDFPRLNAMGIDYVVLAKPILNCPPLFSNRAYAVYATSFRDSQ
jgi:hypothetical protein